MVYIIHGMREFPKIRDPGTYGVPFEGAGGSSWLGLRQV